jgi:chromate transporter
MSARGWLIAAAVAAGLLLVPLTYDAKLAQLNLTLMKVDLMAFGGGWTSVPLIQREVVDRFAWMSTREFIDGIALGQITPGPIVITATFVGYKVAGLLGALLGTLAVFFPSFLMVTGLAPHYERIKRSRYVQLMVRGILAAFMGMMLLLIAYRFGQEALTDWRSWALMAVAWVALWRKVDLLLVVGVGAAVSLLLF